jgi:hypothetical protein
MSYPSMAHHVRLFLILFLDKNSAFHSFQLLGTLTLEKVVQQCWVQDAINNQTPLIKFK